MSEKLARQFHEAYERLAPRFGYETRTETRAFDPYTPNGRLMIAVCAEIDRSHLMQMNALRAANTKLVGALDMIRETLQGGNVEDLLLTINNALEANRRAMPADSASAIKENGQKFELPADKLKDSASPAPDVRFRVIPGKGGNGFAYVRETRSWRSEYPVQGFATEQDAWLAVQMMMMMTPVCARCRKPDHHVSDCPEQKGPLRDDL